MLPIKELLSATQGGGISGRGRPFPILPAPPRSHRAAIQRGKDRPHERIELASQSAEVMTTSINIACVNPSLYPSLGLPHAIFIQVALRMQHDPGDGDSEGADVLRQNIRCRELVPITATATAAARGGGIPPYHVMVVLDTTASMGPPNLDTG